MTSFINIDANCNHADDGSFEGRAYNLSIGRYSLELACQSESGPSFRVCANRFFLSGKGWTFHGSTDWVGNWCWNRYWLAENDAAAFIVWLIERDLFSVESGTADLIDAFQKGITCPEIWRQMLLGDRGVTAHD